MTLLTKSKYMDAIKCNKLLWRTDRKELPELTISDKHKFAQGHDFEEYVKELFPGGVDLKDIDFKENLDKTQELIKERKPIFEAGIRVDSYYVRVDMLIPTKTGWNLCEIKSSTKVKPEHIPDLAFQLFVCEKAGLTIENCYVYFLNKEYVKMGDIDAKALVSFEDVTGQVMKVVDIEKNAAEALTVLRSDTCPPITISQNCKAPYDCPLLKECWSTLPEHSVLELKNWRVYWKLFNSGVIDMRDVPEDLDLNGSDSIIKNATLSGTTFVSKEHLMYFLRNLNYPIYHFDFETYDIAVPLFDHSRAWQKIPFQFSLHVESEDGSLEHHEFLFEGSDDPRLELLKKMDACLGEVGDILVYYKTFEVGRLQELAMDFPEFKDRIENWLSRIVDLYDVFSNLWYYNPSQHGSASIKKVLPALTGKGYSDMDISNGAEASMLYFYSHVKSDLVSEKEKIRTDLLEYCELDTLGMVWILAELRKLA